MLRIEPTPAPETEPRLDDVQAVVITSANAARALIQRSLGAMLMERELPLFAVGEATARAARDAGFGRVVSSDGDVDALVAAVRRQVDPRRGTLLYPCGAHTARDLVAALARRDLACLPVVVYHAVPAHDLPRDVEHGLRERRYDLILFYSARTAGVFCDLAETYGVADSLHDSVALCLSAAVAGRAQAMRFRSVDVARRPDQRAMLDAVRQYVSRARDAGPVDS
jgi:uroporphyrinogen-III synthase